MERSSWFRPTTRHQRISRKLGTLLVQHVEQHDLGEVFYSPVDVILGEGDNREVVEPDLLFIAKARSAIVKLHGIEGAPDLIVEILSPGTQERDRGYKKTLYARHRVREYWIVDPDAKTAERYILQAQDFNAPESFGAGGSRGADRGSDHRYDADRAAARRGG